MTAAMCSGDLDAVLRWRMRLEDAACGIAVEDAVLWWLRMRHAVEGAVWRWDVVRGLV